VANEGSGRAERRRMPATKPATTGPIGRAGAAATAGGATRVARRRPCNPSIIERAVLFILFILLAVLRSGRSVARI
jgi:hypothetical protein